MGDPKDMGIDRHEVGVGVLYHHYIGSLLTHTCEGHELFLGEGDFPLVTFDDPLGHFDEVECFVVEKRTALDEPLDLVEIGSCQRVGVWIFGKKCRCDDIDPLVGALS